MATADLEKSGAGAVEAEEPVKIDRVSGVAGAVGVWDRPVLVHNFISIVRKFSRIVEVAEFECQLNFTQDARLAIALSLACL